MAPPQAIPILGQMEDTPVQVSYLWTPGGCHICPRAAGLTSIMAQEVTRIVAPFWPPGVYSSPTRIMAPPQATPILCQIKSIYLFKSPIYDFLVATMTLVLTLSLVSIKRQMPRPRHKNKAIRRLSCHPSR